jgi:riboflavin kinase / FMN adenylyltransferase
MKIITNALSSSPCVATIGFFDGVHKGHQYLIQQVQEVARAKRLKSMVITFYNHPQQILEKNYSPNLLTSFDEKISLLEKTGVDLCFPITFTNEFSHLTAAEFIRKYLHDILQVKVLLMGFNHHFGYDDISFSDCCKEGEKWGMEVMLSTECNSFSEHICSSLLRDLIKEGDMSKYITLSGHRYNLKGIVIQGNQLGRKIGFPTANIDIKETNKAIPLEGVYAVNIDIDGGKYIGMANIGRKPTIENNGELSLEVHIIDFSKDIYGHIANIEFIKRIRSEKRFDSLAELSQALHKDLNEIKKIFEREDFL